MDRTRSLLIVKPSALGDVVHALPVLHALRRRFPDARIDWLVNQSYRSLLDGHPDLDEVIPLDRHAFKRGWRDGFRSMGSLIRRLRSRRYDTVIDMQGLLRSGVLSRLSGARHRVGFAQAREGSRRLYTHLIDAPTDLHAVDRCWRVAGAFGAGGVGKRFFVPVTPAARDAALRALAGRPRPWLVVGPGARWLTKRWPPAHFGELARRAVAEFGGTVVLVGAPDEKPLADLIAGSIPSVNLAGATTLPQLTAVLSLADAVLANDTGPLHLAAALGRPVVAPYTCTAIDRHGPHGSFGTSVATAVACRASYVRACADMRCMSELTPARLWPALRGVMQRWRLTCRSA